MLIFFDIIQFSTPAFEKNDLSGVILIQFPFLSSKQKQVPDKKINVLSQSISLFRFSEQTDDH
jgi:hypothetical protein